MPVKLGEQLRALGALERLRDPALPATAGLV
jgi:hypothetical protein